MRTTTVLKRRKYVIIGAGMSGASAASELKKQGIPSSEILILEKNNYAGGMMCTVKGIDLGAKVLMSNYPSVNTVYENNLSTVNFLPIDKKTVNHILYDTEQPSIFQQVCYGMRLCYESIFFAKEVWSYHNACQNLQSSPPLYQGHSFAEFAEQKDFSAIAKFLKLWVPLMGYGSLNTIPAYRVLSYMSYDSVFGLSVFNAACSPFYVCVKGGYQQIVENMLKDFELKSSIKIQSIERSDDKAEITFVDSLNETYSIEADNLILATPPKYWPNLNMELTDTERECVEQSTYYRYPVAICDIENFPAHQVIVPEALEENGFGHIALICAQEEVKHGWRCSIYMNVKPGDHGFELSENSVGRNVLLEDLKNLGFDKVNIIDTEVWNYNTCIPWEIGMQLEREQGRMRTLHVNGAKPNSFETVKRTEESARETIRRHLKMQNSQSDVYQYLNTVSTFFFKLPREQTPVTELSQPRRMSLSGE